MFAHGSEDLNTWLYKNQNVKLKNGKLGTESFHIGGYLSRLYTHKFDLKKTMSYIILCKE